MLGITRIFILSFSKEDDSDVSLIFVILLVLSVWAMLSSFSSSLSDNEVTDVAVTTELLREHFKYFPFDGSLRCFWCSLPLRNSSITPRSVPFPLTFRIRNRSLPPVLDGWIFKSSWLWTMDVSVVCWLLCEKLNGSTAHSSFRMKVCALPAL